MLESGGEGERVIVSLTCHRDFKTPPAATAVPTPSCGMRLHQPGSYGWVCRAAPATADLERRDITPAVAPRAGQEELNAQRSSYVEGKRLYHNF